MGELLRHHHHRKCCPSCGRNRKLLFTACFCPPSWLSGRVVFHIPDWLHHLLMTGRILFKNTLEAYTDYYLQYKLNQVVQEHRLVSLITLLRGTLRK